MIVRVKDGVQFTTIAPGGFRLLGAIEGVARALGHPLTITSACDGLHSGPDDPHYHGEAYDVRSHDLDSDTKGQVLAALISDLGRAHFFAFLEAPGTANEHFHLQVKRGATYP